MIIPNHIMSHETSRWDDDSQSRNVVIGTGLGQTVRHSIAGHSTIDLPSCQFQVFKVWRR